MLSIRSILVSLALVSTGASAAVPLSGTTTLYISQYSGTTGSIATTIGGQTIETGLLHFSLDPSHASMDNYWTWDWDIKQASIRLNLLVTSSNLASLGISSIPVTINEHGPIGDAPLVIPDQENDIELPSFTGTGGGTVLSGPFQGFTFANDNYYDGIIVKDIGNNSGNNNGSGNTTGKKLKVKVKKKGHTSTTVPGQTMSFTSVHEGTIITPTGILLASSGAGAGVAGGAPEPETWCLLVVGFFTLGGALRITRSARNKTLGTIA